MTHQELLSQLENAKNNYILGLAALSLFTAEGSLGHLEKSEARFGSYTLSFGQVAALLRNELDRDIAVKEFLNMLLRALIKEAFELLKTYTADTAQNTSLKGEAWYQFARLIRNCLSHSFTFTFNPYDRKMLPVCWRERSIEIQMDGAPLALDFFGYVEAWELFRDFNEFAQNRLT